MNTCLLTFAFSSFTATIATASISSQAALKLEVSNNENSELDDMPSGADIETINKDIKIMLNGMLSGEVDSFMEKTHPSLFPLLGGKENFKKFTQEAVAQLDSMGIKILSTEYESPGQFYKTGNQKLSIVPRVTLMEIQGQRIKTTGFMVAIKNTSTKTWTYLDGSGLREDKSMLWEIFPDLTTNIQFPENKIEKLEP